MALHVLWEAHRQWCCQARSPVLFAAAQLQLLAWRHGSCLPVMQADAAGAAATGSTRTASDAAMSDVEGTAADADEPAGVTEQLPTLDGQAALLSLRLLAAIAGYQHCVPRAMVDSRIDVGRLMPSVGFCCSSTVPRHLLPKNAHKDTVCWHAVTASASAPQGLLNLLLLQQGTFLKLLAGRHSGALWESRCKWSLLACLCRIR